MAVDPDRAAGRLTYEGDDVLLLPSPSAVLVTMTYPERFASATQ